jgi:dodecin
LRTTKEKNSLNKTPLFTTLRFITTKEFQMSVAKVIEIIASSNKSFEDAMVQGVAKASETLQGITGAWVQDQSVKVKDGKVTEYRVVMKLTFVLKD